MECPEVVSELARAYVWHVISTSSIGKLVCGLDASGREPLVAKGFSEIYPIIAAIFQDQSTNFNVPSATIIESFSKSTTKELEIIGTDIGTLPCRHRSHMVCLEKHLSYQNKCSLCRTILKQGIDRADIEDTQARQAVRSMLGARKPGVALVFAEASLECIVLRARQNPSTMNKRNFAMAMVACSDCYLRTGKYKVAYEVAQNALGVYPQLSRLQRAEIFRLQANALASDGGM
ncbi:uncharacterized protein LY89DRAFT_789786 [Mollisia scopiformis]|uniref:Kazal-like domain-containing protein n=1 Tax=Mollisia scopiformis TaxID=149040 RepID=A0A132B4H9_MOLSC|nr:uncharacterized protein LY89DRAFT_789786 [Mollisia scopiformis]KUJ07325.1 hypothetical protein LY89DRAFT_789786 [Mollisia scopiformis]